MRDIIDIQSNDNALFVTGRCNNRCMMCCQPPVAHDDIDGLYAKNLRLVESAPKELDTIGITGGEPTLLGNRLISLLQHIRQHLPDTFIHILSNGRRFSDEGFTKEFATAADGHAMVGIPLHADSPLLHDQIAGVEGAYNETMLGLYNLATYDIDIELRIVVNKMNYKRLPKMAFFISKNLAFVSCVAFMAMEDIGYTIQNREKVWIEPLEYVPELEKAVSYLAQMEFDVSLYNFPLCLLPCSLHFYAKKSISDWKNNYAASCEKCALKSECCGLFSTSRHSFQGLTPFV